MDKILFVCSVLVAITLITLLVIFSSPSDKATIKLNNSERIYNLTLEYTGMTETGSLTFATGDGWYGKNNIVIPKSQVEKGFFYIADDTEYKVRIIDYSYYKVTIQVM